MPIMRASCGSFEHSFRARDEASVALVVAEGQLHRLAKGLEERLRLVMVVPAVGEDDVQVRLQAPGQPAKELGDRVRLEVADAKTAEPRPAGKRGAASQIE